MKSKELLEINKKKEKKIRVEFRMKLIRFVLESYFKKYRIDNLNYTDKAKLVKDLQELLKNTFKFKILMENIMLGEDFISGKVLVQTDLKEYNVYMFEIFKSNFVSIN